MKSSIVLFYNVNKLTYLLTMDERRSAHLFAQLVLEAQAGHGQLAGTLT